MRADQFPRFFARPLDEKGNTTKSLREVIFHLFGWSHSMQNSRCALTKRPVVLNICTLNFIGYLYFMQIFIPLGITHNCGLHYITLVAHLKWGKGNDL